MKSILAFLPIVVLSITYVFILWKNNFKYNKWFWPISFFYLILIRSDDLFRPYTLCPDEEQWLICANSIIESPYNYVKYFLLFDFSRLFTILPLCLFSPITDYISYEHARILNLLIYFGIIFFIHKCADLFFQNNSEIPTILSAYLLMFFSLSRDYDFIAYNSELPAILLLIISCYLVLKKINRNKLDFAHMFIAGNLISSTINAKEQIFAISFFIGSCIVIYLWLNKKYFALLGYISGAITSVILLHAILFWFYSFGDYKMIIDTGYEYSKTAVFSKKNFVDNLKNLVDIVLLSRDYIILSLIVTLSYFLYVKKLIREKSLKNAYLLIFAFLLHLLVLYTIYRPKNFFVHYTLFLIIPNSIMLAKIIQLIVTKKHSTTLILFAFVLLFISKTYGHDKRLFMPLSAISNLKTKINFSSDSLCDLSTSNIDKKNKLFLWGWHLRKYVKFELMRSSGQITPQFAIQDKYSHKNKFVSHFITDLNTQKPKYIIEEFGAGHFFLSDTTATSLLNISDSLSLFIKKNYDICASKSNYRVYARRY